MKKTLSILMCFVSFQMQAFEYEQASQQKHDTSIHSREDNNSHEISIDIKINCPMSAELMDFVRSIPPADNYSSSFEEWKLSFVNSMNQLIRLVESEKVNSSFWSVKTDEHLSQEVKDN